MNGQTLPPVRTTHVWRAPGGLWCYDTWGKHGRPIVLIPAVLFDRVMWWPAAAELRAHATVVAVDLPGHGASTRRHRYNPYELVDDLAELVHHLGVQRAPVVIGHASAAPLATLFATQYPVHAVVIVDPPDTPHPPAQPTEYLSDLGLDAIPACYRDMVTPSTDAGLLAAYASCTDAGPARGWASAVAQPARLAVHSQTPPRHTTRPADQWRHEIYDVAGRFAHLTDLHRFARDVRALL
jgi:pimeloyl-ACP methyl ester carboxylesterase